MSEISNVRIVDADIPIHYSSHSTIMVVANGSLFTLHIRAGAVQRTFSLKRGYFFL